MNNYDNYQKIIVYNFDIGYGGIGDLIKFFMQILNLCIKYEIKLFYQINNIFIEKYLKLKYEKMYISKDNIINPKIIHYNDIQNINNNVYNIVTPFTLYDYNHLSYYTCNHDYNNILCHINEVFYFSDDIKNNIINIISINFNDYISVHLRLGDKYLETDTQYIQCKYDSRYYNEEKLNNFIENNNDKNIIFFCDNNNYKLKIKNTYNYINITNSNIGHISLVNTTDKQVLDGITEFYLMTKSKQIFYASSSGFSLIAARFDNIPFLKIDNMYYIK